MKDPLKIIVALAILCCLFGESFGQITAVTSDGRKVILNDDGTWKYVFENDGRKVILNPDGTWKYADSDSSKTVLKTTPSITPVVVPVVAAGVTTIVTRSDSARVADSLKNVVVVPPPKPKPPPNLECSALVSVLKDGDKYTAVARDILVSQDSKTGFKISIRKTKNTPLTWATSVIGGGQCFNDDSKMTIAFRDGGHIQIPHDGKANCEGIFRLSFGGEAGKEEILDMLRRTEVAGIRIITTKGFVEQEFTEEAYLRFKAALGCMPK